MAKKSFSVTPFDVQGTVDYARLAKEFGLQSIDDKLLQRFEKAAGDSHFMLRRGIFYAHRDMNWLLDQFDKGNKFFLYTGIGPSGPIHLGHTLVWQFTKWLQDTFGCELWFQFTDDEKFLFKDLTTEQVNEYMVENMKDIIALGFDPKKTHFVIDTKHADVLYPEAIKVAKKITFSMVKATFGMNESSNIGQIFYTSMQAVPAFLPSIVHNKKMPCLIPHAVDQDPHFRLTRDILPKLGYPKPASIQCPFMPPLKGADGKMSSSDPTSYIALTDDAKAVKKKINKYAFSGGKDTVEEHRKKGGNPDIDVAYQYLRIMFEPDDKKLKIIHDDYKAGKLLSGELKAILIEKVNEFLVSHQKARAKVTKKTIEKFIWKG